MGQLANGRGAGTVRKIQFESRMKRPITINGWLIQATQGLLRHQSPGLCNLIRPADSQSEPQTRLLATYELSMSYREACAIYSTLDVACQKFGHDRLFEGMPLRTMTEMWRQYSTRLDDTP